MKIFIFFVNYFKFCAMYSDKEFCLPRGRIDLLQTISIKSFVSGPAYSLN